MPLRFYARLPARDRKKGCEGERNPLRTFECLPVTWRPRRLSRSKHKPRGRQGHSQPGLQTLSSARAAPPQSPQTAASERPRCARRFQTERIPQPAPRPVRRNFPRCWEGPDERPRQAGWQRSRAAEDPPDKF